MHPMVVELDGNGQNVIGVLSNEDLYGGWDFGNLDKAVDSFQNLFFSNKYSDVLARGWKEVARIPWEFMI